MAAGVAAITGGAGGIGRAFADVLLARGYKVALLDIAGYDDAAAALNARHGTGTVIGLRCDVTVEADIRAALRTAIDRLRAPLRLMCNNAGIATPLLEDIDRAVAINLTAVIKGTAVARELMEVGGGGIIVNTASVAGLGPVDFSPVYAATKAGVVNFSRSLRWLADAENIRVAAICPNFTDTAMVRDAMSDSSFSAVVASQPGGLLTPARVAEALVLMLEHTDLAGAVIIVTAHKGVRVVQFPAFGGEKGAALSSGAAATRARL